MQEYRRRGVGVVRDVFSSDEIERWRGEAQAAAGGNVAERDELLCYPGLRDVVLHKRVLEVAREILGPEVVYFGDSTFFAADRFSRHLHVDARNDFGDLQSDYPIIRLGVYLQDHAQHGDGLKVGIGSHRRVLWRPNNLKRLIGMGRGTRLRAAAFIPPRLWNVDSRAGDLVFWNLRTHHSAHAVRLKHLPWLPLHPVVEGFIPTAWTIPSDRPRYALFMSFGAPGQVLNRFLDHMRWNPHKESLRQKRSGFRDPEVAELAARAGLSIRSDWAGATTSFAR